MGLLFCIFFPGLVAAAVGKNEGRVGGDSVNRFSGEGGSRSDWLIGWVCQAVKGGDKKKGESVNRVDSFGR